MKTNINDAYKWFFLVLILLISACANQRTGNQETKSKALSEDGTLISFGVKGHGDPAIVFVHCWTCNHKIWTHQIEYFSKQHKVIWLDLAGHGQSGGGRSVYTMEAFGKDVAAVVNKTDAKEIVLVGHSMGGPVVIEAAKLLGDKVVGIVGVDTFYTAFQSPGSELEIENFVEPFRKDFAGTSRQMIQSMFTPNTDSVLKTSIIEQFSEANPKVGISAMVEMLKWSNKKGQSSLQRFSDKLKNINAAPTGKEPALHKSVTLIPGVGHFIPQVKPNEFNAELSKIIHEY